MRAARELRVRAVTLFMGSSKVLFREWCVFLKGERSGGMGCDGDRLLKAPLQPDQGKEWKICQGFRTLTPPRVEVIEEGIPAVQGIENP